MSNGAHEDDPRGTIESRAERPREPEPGDARARTARQEHEEEEHEGSGAGGPLKTAEPEKVQMKIPPQEQPLPGRETAMRPEPVVEDPRYQGTNKLGGKVALITGGDSGIGRAVAVLFAKEGADVAIVYLDEHGDAEAVKARIEALGRRCVCIPGDVGEAAFCTDAVERTVRELGRLDILVNNAAEQHLVKDLAEVDTAQLERTFRTNIFGYFYMAKAALPHLGEGAAIINTTSVQAYEPNPGLIDYALTKGAILTFTRALAKHLAEKNIRVNGVAPGPVWTPLVAASFPPEKLEHFGESVPLKRPAQPAEIAPSYVFLASTIDSSYITGQILHPNGGGAMYS